MKNIILIFVFFTFCSFSYSQKKGNKPTRQQTEIWLKEKINKYVYKEDYFSFEDEISRKTISGSKKNIKVELTENSIIITCDVEEFTSNRFLIDGPEVKKRNYKETITILLKDLKNKVFIKDNYLVFESNYNSFNRTTSEGYNSTQIWAGLKIDIYGEENFPTRFDKAMNHLLTFIKKNKVSETF